MTMTERSALNAARRARELTELGERSETDVLVIGGGITGVGIALDAATRGLSVVLAERRDLAHGTSRFSSKLAHGGLRYLATGQIGVAHESAVERHILAIRTAPHLIHPYRQIVPLTPKVGKAQGLLQRVGLLMGDGLRKAAGTPSSFLPWSHPMTAEEVAQAAPAVTRDGLRGGLRSWDCQLIDDARLVIAMARTAAAYGARVLTRVAVSDARGDGARLTDELTGSSLDVRAKTVINATGVWAAEIDPAIRLRPSRGTHLVFSAAQFRGLDAGLLAPVPGSISRFIFALPADLGRVYLGLTDVDAPGEIPDVAEPDESEIRFLLDIVNPMLAKPLERSDVLGAFAGLRPLIDSSSGSTADVSRKHAIIESTSGVLTIVGGKLTTYRRMAQDVLDRAVADGRIGGGPCRTTNLPLVGAGQRGAIARISAPMFTSDDAPTGGQGSSPLAPMVARFGTEAEEIIARAATRPGMLDPVAPGLSVTRAELEFSITHEGALTPEDLLDRRTRIGLVPSDRSTALPAADSLLTDTKVS